MDYVILEYIEENKIGLIVMGTRGRTGFKNLISGNIASSVLSYSHCTITTVK